jgi:hypothetical protein
MKRKMISALALICIFIFILPLVSAAQSTKPVNIALVNPIQVFPEDVPIQGIRLNFIYGKNVSMVGFDWGLANHVGTGGFTGLQWGAVNICDGKCSGVQLGLVNFNQKNVEGFQWGWYNRGDYVNGFQLGLVNSAESMKGLQIGLVNIIKTGGEFPVFPIVNWSF